MAKEYHYIRFSVVHGGDILHQNKERVGGDPNAVGGSATDALKSVIKKLRDSGGDLRVVPDSENTAVEARWNGGFENGGVSIFAAIEVDGVAQDKETGIPVASAAHLPFLKNQKSQEIKGISDLLG